MSQSVPVDPRFRSNQMTPRKGHCLRRNLKQNSKLGHLCSRKATQKGSWPREMHEQFLFVWPKRAVQFPQTRHGKRPSLHLYVYQVPAFARQANLTEFHWSWKNWWKREALKRRRRPGSWSRARRLHARRLHWSLRHPASSEFSTLIPTDSR